MSVWLPLAPIDFLRRRGPRETNDTRAILLAVEDRQRQIVAACCKRALAAGVRKGMPVGQARALFSEGRVRIEEHDAARDRAALRSLAAWARRWSPLVAPDGPDGLLVDVSGCERVWGGEDRLVDAALGDLRRLGFQARAAIAPTFGCAWGVARFGAEDRSIVRTDAAGARADGAAVRTGARGVRTGAGSVRTALAPLPVAALRIDEASTSALAELGIERVGDLLDLPRSALPARFGDALLLQLDRALGLAIETIEPVRPEPPPRLERVFDGPTDRTEAIEHTVCELIGELSRELLTRECGVRVLVIDLVRSDLPPERLSITLGRPSRDAKHLWGLVRPRLERAHLGFGVEAVRVLSRRVGRLRHDQKEHWGDGSISDGERERAAAELIDTLSNRFGRGRVVRAEMVESHLPEHAVAWRPALDAPRSAGRVGRAEQAGLTPGDRPTVVFDRPLPARVVTLLPDGPVHRVAWRGGEHAIVSCRGPERVSPEWWRPGSDGVERDYFCVQSETGLWLWLCRRAELGRDAWAVEGVWA